MTTREHLIEHADGGVAHHANRAASYRAKARIHLAKAKEYTEKGESVLAEHERDLAHHENMGGDHHDARQKDYERLREHWANASGADVIDSHASAGDAVRNVLQAERAKAMWGD